MSDERFARIEARLSELEKENIKNVITAEYLDSRLGEIKGTLVWLTRLLIGTILTTITTAALAFAFSGGIPGATQ